MGQIGTTPGGARFPIAPFQEPLHSRLHSMEPFTTALLWAIRPDWTVALRRAQFVRSARLLEVPASPLHPCKSRCIHDCTPWSPSRQHSFGPYGPIGLVSCLRELLGHSAIRPFGHVAQTAIRPSTTPNPVYSWKL